MFARLKRGQVLKSKPYKNEKISYTIILQKKPFLLELYKTVKLSRNWENNSSKLEVRVRKYDFTNYTNKIINEKLRLVDDKEEIEKLRENLENLPEKTQRKIYGRGNLEIIASMKFFPDSNYNPSCNFAIKKVNEINSGNNSNIESFSKDLADKFYKKALSITQILPL